MLSLPIQALSSSRNTCRDAPRNHVLPDIWASLGPAMLTHKINHHVHCMPGTVLSISDIFYSSQDNNGNKTTPEDNLKYFTVEKLFENEWYFHTTEFCPPSEFQCRRPRRSPGVRAMWRRQGCREQFHTSARRRGPDGVGRQWG